MACSVYFGSMVVTVYMDHSLLQFLKRMAPHNAKRWSLELQQYNLNGQHCVGKENLFPAAFVLKQLIYRAAAGTRVRVPG